MCIYLKVYCICVHGDLETFYRWHTIILFMRQISHHRLYCDFGDEENFSWLNCPEEEWYHRIDHYLFYMLTTCLLHVGSPFENRFLNTSWAASLTYWIVYLFFCILTYAIIYVLIHHIIFCHYLYFLNILYFFKYSCPNIFHRCSLCTFYWMEIELYLAGCMNKIYW